MRGNIQAEGLLISDIRSLNSSRKRHDESVGWQKEVGRVYKEEERRRKEEMKL